MFIYEPEESAVNVDHMIFDYEDDVWTIIVNDVCLWATTAEMDSQAITFYIKDNPSACMSVDNPFELAKEMMRAKSEEVGKIGLPLQEAIMNIHKFTLE